MTGDTGASTETGSTSSGGAGGFSGGQYFGGGRGTLIRGEFQYLSQLALRQLRSQQGFYNLEQSQILSHVPHGFPSATVQTNVPIKVTELLTKLAEVGTQYYHMRSARLAERKRAHNEAAIAVKIRRQLARSPVPTYQTIALTGLNMGPPIPGATYY